MKRSQQYVLIIALFIIYPLAGFAQVELTPTPTATSIPLFDSFCYSSVDDDQSIVINGDFDSYSQDGLEPSNWGPGSSSNGGILREQVNADESVNFVVELSSGASISQVLSSGRNPVGYTRFDIRFCAIVPAGGRLKITVGGNTYYRPENRSDSVYSRSFSISDIFIDTSMNNSLIVISYEGEGLAFIDNLEVVPNLTGGNDDDTPTPTPTIENTPAPTATEGPSPTPTPTLLPGTATPTPTPALVSNSVQILANPPMLLVSPDDFLLANRQKKQTLLEFQVVGSDGEKIDVAAVDDDAQVKFTIDTSGEATDVGGLYELMGSGTNQEIHQNWQPYEDYDDKAIYFVPRKSFDGIVRVIVDIRYEASAQGHQQRQEIRGVVPIVMRIDPTSPLTGTTGSFNAAQNYAAGRKAGDRGFRPDIRTNLYFKERLE